MFNDNEDADEIQILKQKAEYFFNSNEPVHIKFKKGYWKRGVIIELKENHFSLQEFIEGDIPIFFLEVYSIEKYVKGASK